MNDTFALLGRLARTTNTQGVALGYVLLGFQPVTECPIQFTTVYPIQFITEFPIQLATECPIQFTSECPIQLS